MWCHWEFFPLLGFLQDWVTLSDRLPWQTRHNKNATHKHTILINTINPLSIVGKSTQTASPSSMVSPTLIWMRRPNRAFMPRSFSLFISCVWSSYSRKGSRLLIAVAFPSPWPFFLVRHNLALGSDWVRGNQFYICLHGFECNASQHTRHILHMRRISFRPYSDFCLQFRFYLAWIRQPLPVTLASVGKSIVVKRTSGTLFRRQQ